MLFCIHNFEKWKDVLVFYYASDSYILQARKCTRCHEAFFKFKKAGGVIVSCHNLSEKKLIPLGFFEETNNTDKEKK